MLNLNPLLVVIVGFSVGYAFNIERLIQKADIYYQQPLQNGKPFEFPLNMIETMQSKTDIKVIIHGFTGNRFHNSIRPLKHAYMAQGIVNLLLVDWKDAAGLDYASSRNAVADVGIYLGKMLDEFFNKHEIPLSEVQIIGHSLGAHIAGNIGRYFNGSLARVTGLDPALPLFSPNSSDGLQSSAAKLVDVIHTDYPVFGDITPRGTVDFYPNYGHTPQKGCDKVDIVSASKLIFDAYSCSHNRAVVLYAESIGIPKNFPAIPCSLKTIRLHKSANQCLEESNTFGLTRIAFAKAIEAEDESIVVYMGEHVSQSTAGIFYLDTYDAPPYGMGVYTQLP